MAKMNLMSGIKAGSGATAPVNTNVGKTRSAPLSNQVLYSSGTQNLTSSVTQDFYKDNIINPNGKALTNIQIQLSRTDATGATPPTSINPVNTALTRFRLIGNDGITYLDCTPQIADQFQHIQKLVNKNGYRALPDTPADSVANTSYTGNYYVQLQNWGIPAKAFPLRIEYTANTLQSIAGTLNTGTSSISLRVLGDFVSDSVVPSVIRAKIIANVPASTYDFAQNLSKVEIYSVGVDVGSVDTNLTTTGSIQVNENGVGLIPLTDYQQVINAEAVIGGNTTATQHETGFFPIAVLNGFRTLMNRTNADQVVLSFGTAPNVNGVSGQACLYTIEAPN